MERYDKTYEVSHFLIDLRGSEPLALEAQARTLHVQKHAWSNRGFETYRAAAARTTTVLPSESRLSVCVRVEARVNAGRA